MLCESWNINKNPRYKIIKYKNEYLMIDVTSSWIFFFIPMLNWGVPKKFAKISQSEFEELNTFTPKNSSSAGFTAGSISAILVYWTNQKNEFGIKDKNDWIGHKLDVGIDAVEKSAEKTVDGVENVMVKLQKVFLII